MDVSALAGLGAHPSPQIAPCFLARGRADSPLDLPALLEELRQ